MYTGKLVRLRAYRNEDAERAWQFITDPEIKTYLTTRVPFPETFEDERKWVERQTAYRDDSTYNFAIETLEDSLYIGSCGINELNWSSSFAVVGIMIGDRDYWDRGYGGDAMHVLIRFCFEQMNLNKVSLNVYSLNPRAIRCYEKLGFKKEGVLRQELYRNGAYHDVIHMGLLRDEWQP